MSSNKEVDKFRFHSFLEQVICDDSTDEILSWSSPTMETQNEGFVGVFISQMSPNQSNNNVDDKMLSMQLLLQLFL